jgi:DNA repair exonuclease SbcCD ATPase subunit
MYNHFIPNFLTKFLSKCTILTPHSRIRDKQAEIKLIQDKLVVPTQDIKDLELDEEELSAELEEETQKWHARWPEQEECCMILKLELSRVQAEVSNL